MKTGKLTLALVGMFILGALGFWVVAALMEIRMGRQILSPEQPVASGEPLAILRQGAQETLKVAETALRQNHRSDAVTAMDGAMRATEVGQEATGERGFKQGCETVMHARSALQNGNPKRAQELLAKGAVEFRK